MPDSASTKLVAGAQAPDFSLASHDGRVIRLSEACVRPIVLYFYPKDNTEGCTFEATEFRDRIAAFEALGVAVMGVCPDSVHSHTKFAAKLELNFPLLADFDHRVTEAYGLWVKKRLYGRKFWGVQRATFLIGEDRRIDHLWPRVHPRGHAEQVLEFCRTALT